MKKAIALILTLILCITMVSPVLADQDQQVFLQIKMTGVQADTVFNTDGYASLKTNPVITDQGEMLVKPQAALMDRYGNLAVSFRDTWLSLYYDSVSGVVSQTGPNDRRRYCFKDDDDFLPDRPVFFRLGGGIVLDWEMDAASPMHEGYALVRTDLPQEEYKPCSIYDALEVTTTLRVVDANGRTVYTFPDAFGAEIGGMGDYFWSESGYLNSATLYSDGLIGCRVWDPGMTDSYVRFIHPNGAPYMDIDYTNCGYFSEGLAPVYSDADMAWGYIDKNGDPAVSFIYDDCGDFSDGLAPVAINDNWGYVDKEGNVRIALEYEMAYGAAEGFAAVKKDGKCGLVDYDNNVVLPFIYDEITTCKGGIAYAIKDRWVYTIRLLRDPSVMFTDVPSDAWYHDAVAYCVRTELFEGTSATTFEPLTAMSRAMFVMTLANLNGVDINNDAPTVFSDVPRNEWYTGAVKWANENNIVAGVGNGLFKPNDPVTREQICVMLKNYFDLMQVDLVPIREKIDFKDANEISDWAREAVEACQLAGLVEGADGCFFPKKNATRAEVAQIYTNYLE